MKKNIFINIFLFAFIFSFIACSNKTKTIENEIEAESVETNIDNSPLTLEKFDTIKLLTPAKKYGKSLMECAWNRKSNREFSDKFLSLQQLSDLMWLSYGINRPNDSTRNRSVPSAMARYPLEVFAVLANGIYYYDAINHLLIPYIEGDFRNDIASQPFVADAPLNIFFFLDNDKYNNHNRQISDESKLYFAALDAAHSCQNIYLYCASENLNTVERAMTPENTCQIFNLDRNLRFIVAQTIGFPK